MGQKSKTQNVTKVKNSKFYKTQQLKYNKTRKKLNVTKLKKESICDKPYKIEL